MAYPIERQSERLIVREWRADEVHGMHRWLGDPKVNEFLAWGTDTLEASAAHLRETICAQRNTPREKYYLAVELVGSPGRTIGDVGFTWIEPQVAEIGYFLEAGYWGRGYATEAAQIIIKIAFELGARTVLATCHRQNTASQAVMKRCGMNAMASADSQRLVYGLER